MVAPELFKRFFVRWYATDLSNRIQTSRLHAEFNLGHPFPWLDLRPPSRTELSGCRRGVVNVTRNARQQVQAVRVGGPSRLSLPNQVDGQ